LGFRKFGENKTMIHTQKLTNLQLELVKLFSYKIAESQVLEIKQLLSNYFADKATEEMDRLWDENNWTEETMKEWSNEHLRTPYK
jgi:hypothetical protein